jgi:hypothetical protein
MTRLVKPPRLAEYEARKLITSAQARAGDAFSHDAELGSVSVRHADMERLPSHRSAAGYHVTPGDAARRYRKACEALGGLRGIVELVCVQDRPARDWTDGRSERADAALPVLRLGLDVLAAFYQLTEAA